MKVKHNRIVASLAAAGAYMCMPMTAFATDSGSAVKDILMDSRFEGAMSQIQWLTEFIDVWFIRVITVTAFFIISMSLLKNVLAAAYCAFPKIFDAIHAAHEEMQWSEVSIGGFRDLGSKMRDTSITKVILSIIPDIKAFTDFVDQDQTPKAYFMKAIPQMCIMVIMGIFIYNGYYRDVSATVGEAGATIVENLLGSVSPEKAVNDIFNAKNDPKNTYRNDKTLEGGYIKELSNAMFKQIKSYSTVIKQSEENKEALLRKCEYVAYHMVKGDLVPDNDETGGAIFKGTETYDMKLSNVTVTISTQKTGTYCTSDTSNATRAFRFEFDISSTFIENMGSEENLVGKVCVVTGNLTPVAKSDKTFETTIEAVDGTLSTADAGFTSVTVSITGAQVNAQWSGNDAYCDVSLLEPLVATAIKTQLAQTSPGASIEEASVNITKEDSPNKLKLSNGENSNICQVEFNYSVPGTDADGNATEPTVKHAKANVTINLTQ